MSHEEFLLGVQLISDEGAGRLQRRANDVLDQQDIESRRQLGVVDG